MSNSRFENFNDRVLKTCIINLYKLLLEESSENPKVYNISDDEVYDSIEYVIKMFGFGGGDYEDIDFIFALYDLNYTSIKDGKIEGELVRPKLETYLFDVEVSERIYQTVTYQHKEKSYSSKNVIPINRRAEDDGNFSIWDGNIIDTDVHDSDTTDISFPGKVTKL
jgi:hypothetical protein